MPAAQVETFDWSEPTDPGALRTALERDGVFMMRNLLGTDDIARLRAIVTGHFSEHGHRSGLGRTQANAASEVEGLVYAFAHPNVVALFEKIFGPGEVVFTGHCDIHMNMLSNWHKDSNNRNGDYFEGDCFTAQDCRVYKIGLYLQDHQDKNGLSVCPGSHRSRALLNGEVVHLDSRAGDAIIFDVRLSHCGQPADPFERVLKGVNVVARGGRGISPDNRLVSDIERMYWRMMGRDDRLSVFFTFGAPNARTEEFAKASMVRQTRQAGAPSNERLRDVLEALAAKGVRSAVDLAN